MKIVRFALLVVILMLSACSPGGEPTARVAAIPTAPTMAANTATPTAQPTVTPTREATAANTATPTAQPTARPTVTPTREATAANTATPTARPTARPSPTAAPTATPAPSKPAPAAGACQNPYYPVVAGASWTYQVSGTSSGTFTRSIVNVRANGFDDQDVFSVGVTRRGSWQCQQGNLIALTASANPSVVAIEIQANFTVESNSGISFPANPQPGMKWTQKIVFRGQYNAGGVNMESRNVMDLACQAIGMEQVRVPAGEFKALRVDCSTQFEISLSGAPAFTTTVTGSAWYAPGVGSVKSRDASDAGVTEVVLLSYAIP